LKKEIIADVSKRKMFSSLLKPVLNEVLETTENIINSSLENFQGIHAEKTSAKFLFVPKITASLCDGCDACVNICPTQALTFINDEAGNSLYELSPQKCTGCKLCLDICEANAIELSELKSCKTRRILLRTFVCDSCGTSCHVSHKHLSKGNLCRICSQTDHHKKLFQVLV